MINFQGKTKVFMLMFIYLASAYADDVLPLVSGNIIDQENGESLPYAKVSIKETNRITTANQDGSFTMLNIPAGSILIVNKLGYEGKEIAIDQNSKFLTIYLNKQLSNNSIEEIIVLGGSNSNMEQLSGISQLSVSPELTRSLPNLGEQDIFRSLQLLPGVSGSNESSSGLAVRGGTIDQNLVLFDDFTVYHVDHVFGYFSAFNTNAIKDVQLYKGGFGAKYGGRLSSVVDITGKDGNTEQSNIGVNWSLLSTNALYEQPFADGAGSVILTGRRSYQSDFYDDILESITGSNQNAQTGTSSPGQFALGRFTTEPESYFYDVNAKLTYRFPNNDKFTISFYNGADELDNSRNVEGDVNLDLLCDIFGGNGPFGGQFCEEDEFSFAVDTVDLSEWGNTGISAKFLHSWNERLDTNFIISGSTYFSYRDRLIDSQVVYDESSDDPTTGKTSSNEDNKLNDLALKIENDFYLNQWNLLSFGLQINQQNIDFSLIQNDELILENENEAITSSIYLENEITVDRLKIIPGFRTTHYSINDEIYNEPRFSLAYELNESTQLRAGFGDYHQFALSVSRQSIQEGPRNFWTLADGEAIPISKARHYILGATKYFGEYDFSMEFFHKEYDGLSEFIERSVPILNEEGTGLILTLEQEFQTGSGTASGIELFVQKNIGNLTGWSGYTFSEVKYDFPTVSNKTYFADQDTTHEFKNVLMYEWNDWNFATTFIYATGRPYTEVLGVIEDTFPTAFEVGEKNAERYDPYHRLDLSATYSFEMFGGDGTAGFSIFNFYDRKNDWYTEYDVIEGEILETEVKYRGFTPSLYVSWNKSFDTLY